MSCRSRQPLSGRRGDAGVGSDLDLVLILQACDEPTWERLRRWDTRPQPLACDLLVYSLQEWRTLPQWNPRLAGVLHRETRWLGEVSEALQAELDAPLITPPPPSP